MVTIPSGAYRQRLTSSARLAPGIVSNGTATAGTDYVSTSGTLTIPAGSTSGTVAVLIKGDTTDEPNETYFVNLSNATYATITGSQGVGTIVNDDPHPGIAIGNVSITEGNSGTKNASFTVTLSAASGRTIKVNYATANGTATAGSDYVSTSGTLTIPAGSTSGTIAVPIKGDTTVEPDETFFVNLTSPINVYITGSQGVGKILNDDTAVSIGNVSVTEGNSGTINANFKVSLSAAAPFPVTVRYATADGTATAGSDYVWTSGTLTIPAGSTSGTVAVPVVGDTLNEANETFTVKLSSPTNAIVATATGTGTILNDDPVPTLSIGNVSLPEGNSGTTNAVFTVKLSAASGRAVTVHYATADGTATAGSDYTAKSGTLTIPAGSTSGTIAVPVIGDTIVEPNETFFVNLSSPTNATIAVAKGTGTILNDDPHPLLFIHNVSLTEGNSGTKNATFTVTLSATSPSNVTVHYATADGTATAGSDYVATSGTLTIPAGYHLRHRRRPDQGRHDRRAR